MAVFARDVQATRAAMARLLALGARESDLRRLVEAFAEFDQLVGRGDLEAEHRFVEQRIAPAIDLVSASVCC